MTNSLSGSGAGNGCCFGMDATELNFVVANNNNADVYLKTNRSERMRIQNGGNVGIGNNAPIGTLCVGNALVVGSDGNIVIGECTAVGTTRQFKMGLDGSYNFCIGNYGYNNTARTWLNTQFNINYNKGNIWIGAVNSGSYKLYINGNSFLNETQKINASLTCEIITSTTITKNCNAINAGSVV